MGGSLGQKKPVVSHWNREQPGALFVPYCPLQGLLKQNSLFSLFCLSKPRLHWEGEGLKRDKILFLLSFKEVICKACF